MLQVKLLLILDKPTCHDGDNEDKDENSDD